MELMQFIQKHRLPDTMPVNCIPIKHPETGEKIYLQSGYFGGFWYKKVSAGAGARMYPCGYRGDFQKLEVFHSSRTEIRALLVDYKG